MAQFQPPAVFTSGQVLTASALNAHVSSASLLPGAITDQTNLTANTVAAGDSVILHDLSDLALKEATVGDLLNSGLNITTGAIAGKTGVDLIITPAAGQKVDVAGNLEANDLNAVGNVTIGGNLSVTGTLSGSINSSGSFTNSGTANFTGVLQVNGTVGYVLTDIVEETISLYSATQTSGSLTYFTSASYTKPVDEIWVIQVDAHVLYNNYAWMGIKVRLSSPSTDIAGQLYIDRNAGGATYEITQIQLSGIIGAPTTFTSTFIIEASQSQNGFIHGIGYTNWNQANPAIGFPFSIPASKFRIYKYKTA